MSVALSLFISAPSLESIIFVIDSVCLFVTHLQIASFLFLDGIEPFFWPSVLHVALYKSNKTLFLDFLFRPPNAQNILPKIAYKSACMADRPEMFGPAKGVFGDGRFNGTVQNVVGLTLVAIATKFGLGAEIQSPAGLLLLLPSGAIAIRRVCWLVSSFVR